MRKNKLTVDGLTLRLPLNLFRSLDGLLPPTRAVVSSSSSSTGWQNTKSGRNDN